MAKGSFLVSREAARVMIAQGMGGDIVYISSKNSLFAGPEQHRLRRPPRPTRPTRCGCWPPSWAPHGDPGQRHQPRRRRARLRDLRGRLGRQARRGLRGQGGGAGRLLRQAHPAGPGGAARARRRRRRSRSPAATCRRPPGCTSRSTPASPPRSCDDVGDRRSRSPRSTSGRPAGGSCSAGSGPTPRAAPRSHRFRNGAVRLPDGLYWDVLGLYPDILAGLRAAAAARHGALAGLAIDSWAVDYGLLDARGALRGNPRHYRDPRTEAVIDDVHRQGRPGPAVRASPGCSSCRSTRSTSSPPSRELQHGRRGAADPGPARLLAHRRAGRRGDQRLHHRPARRPHRRLVAAR